jgi:hypothetical protein
VSEEQLQAKFASNLTAVGRGDDVERLADAIGSLVDADDVSEILELL